MAETTETEAMGAEAPKLLSREELDAISARIDYLMCDTFGTRDGKPFEQTESRISEHDWIAIRAHIAALEAERDAARTEADELRVKLRPFALWSQYQLDHELPAKVLADADTPVLGDVWSDQPEITVADLREAAAPPARREEV